MSVVVLICGRPSRLSHGPMTPFWTYYRRGPRSVLVVGLLQLIVTVTIVSTDAYIAPSLGGGWLGRLLDYLLDLLSWCCWGKTIGKIMSSVVLLLTSLQRLMLVVLSPSVVLLKSFIFSLLRVPFVSHIWLSVKHTHTAIWIFRLYLYTGFR